MPETKQQCDDTVSVRKELEVMRHIWHHFQKLDGDRTSQRRVMTWLIQRVLGGHTVSAKMCQTVLSEAKMVLARAHGISQNEKLDEGQNG